MAGIDPAHAPAVEVQSRQSCCGESRVGELADPAILAQRLKDNLLAGAEGTFAGSSHSALLFAERLGLLNRLLACHDDALDRVLAERPDVHIFRFPGIGL